MKIYELSLSTWKEPYRGLWSSIGLAMEHLPSCAKFRRAMGHCLPAHAGLNDCTIHMDLSGPTVTLAVLLPGTDKPTALIYVKELSLDELV
jgi:hypothetical protein